MEALFYRFDQATFECYLCDKTYPWPVHKRLLLSNNNRINFCKDCWEKYLKVTILEERKYLKTIENKEKEQKRGYETFFRDGHWAIRRITE
jgi:hypothetical protein